MISGDGGKPFRSGGAGLALILLVVATSWGIEPGGKSHSF